MRAAPFRLRLQFLHCGEDWLAFHDHPLASAVGGIVGRGVLVRGPAAELMHADLQQAALPGALQDALAERPFANRGEKGENVDAHSRGRMRLKTRQVAANGNLNLIIIS